MVNKQSKKFKKRLAAAREDNNSQVVLYRENPAEGIPIWNTRAFLRLIVDRKWEDCLTAAYRFMSYFEVNHYAGYSRDDVRTFNEFVTCIFTMLLEADMKLPGPQAAQFVSYGHLFSNIVAVSYYGTCDTLLKTLISEGNLTKLLFLQNSRCIIQGEVKKFFDASPELATIWYNNYLLGIGCPTKVQQENLIRHIANMDERWTPMNPCVSPSMFTCTYFNQSDAKRAKTIMNAAIKAKCTLKFENNPDPKSIAIVTSKWHRNHAVYKSAGPLVEQLLDKYRLTLIHLGRHKPDMLVTDYFDKVYSVHLDDRGALVVPDEVRKNDFQLAYYPDIGMIDEGIWLSNHRIAPIQAVGYGHPDTTGCSEIDYMVGGDVERDCADWYTEKLVLIPGLGQHPAWPTAPRMNSWQPHDKVLINCVWGPDKYNYNLLSMLVYINSVVGLDKHVWHFYPSPGVNRYGALVPYLNDIRAMIPNSVIHTDIEYYDYMKDAEPHDFSVNSFPFGGYNTVVESFYLGMPCLAVEGPRFYNKAGTELNRMIGMEEMNAATPTELAALVIKMIQDDEYRAAQRAKLASIDLKAKLFQVGPKHFLNAIDHIIANHPIQVNPTLIGEIYGNTQ